MNNSTPKKFRHWKLLAAIALISAFGVWFYRWQTATTLWVQVSSASDFKLVFINGKQHDQRDQYVYLPAGPTTFIYKKDESLYSYTVNLRGGGAVYLYFPDADLVPVKNISGI